MRTIVLAILISGQASAQDSFADTLRSAENPLLGVMRGDQPKRKLDASAGKTDAERDIQSGQFIILRYDVPIVRVGDWSHWDTWFERFSIRATPSNRPQEYCDSYNKVMDEAVSKRYGGTYLNDRSKILPPPGAKPFQYK